MDSRYFAKALDTSERDFVSKILSSEALAILIMDRIIRGVPTSVVRMADGEKALLDVAHDLPPRHFLLDEAWLTKYGLAGKDLKEIGRDLLWAGMHADFFAPAVSGVFVPGYNVHQYFPDREQFIDQFYHRQWWDRGRVKAVMHAGPVMVLTRNHKDVAQRLRELYDLPRNYLFSHRLDSWRDQEAAQEAVQASAAELVLVTGGPSGKRWIVEMARDTGRVVLDLGGALEKVWCRSK
jgi:hypothetical protein